MDKWTGPRDTENLGSQTEMEKEQAMGSSAVADSGVQGNSIDAGNESQGAELVLIHTALCLCTFLVGLDFNLIAVAVPVITTEFGSLSDVGWYGAAFMLAMSSTQSFAGKTYILFPKKWTYLFYLALFEIGSLVCALAPSSRSLIVGRAIAGAGASGIFAGGFSILAAIVPLHKRSIFLGTINSTFAIASIVGPLIGGAFTERVTWRWCFYLNLPIGGFAALVCTLLIKIQPAQSELASLREKLGSLDGVGFILLIGTVVSLLLGFQWGGLQFAWNSPTIIGLFICFALCLILLVLWSIRQQDNALIPPKLFKAHRNVGLLFAGSFFINGPFQLIIYWLPIWFQDVLRAEPIQSGVFYLPTVISDVLAAIVGSSIVMQTGYWNPLIIFSEALVCIGGGLLSTITPEISRGHWIGYQIFGGLGYSLSTTMVHIGLQASVPKEMAPLASSNVLMVISISCSVFLGIGQLVFQTLLQNYLSTVAPATIVARVISGGGTDLVEIAQETGITALYEQYSKATTHVFYITAISPTISFCLVSCCKWVSTKVKASPTDQEDAS